MPVPIESCNEHFTTMPTVELWQALDHARHFCIRQATDIQDPEISAGWHNGAISYYHMQRHIEAMINNGRPLTLTLKG